MGHPEEAEPTLAPLRLGRESSREQLACASWDYAQVLEMLLGRNSPLLHGLATAAQVKELAEQRAAAKQVARARPNTTLARLNLARRTVVLDGDPEGTTRLAPACRHRFKDLGPILSNNSPHLL